MRCDVDGGDMLPGLSSACGGGVESRSDGVVQSGHHSVDHRVLNRDDEVGVLGGVVLFAWERMYAPFGAARRRTCEWECVAFSSLIEVRNVMVACRACVSASPR